ncbi:MAG: CBS domain-containing protein [Planctomycetaceae bacterium]
MSVGKICVRRVDVARPDEPVQACAQRMRARKVGTLVAVNKGCEPIGIITDRDLAVRLVADGLDPLKTLLSEVMTKDPTTVSDDSPVEDALRLMRQGSFRRLPVVDRAGKLSGIVSLDDILDLLSHEFREIGRLLVEESPESLAREFASTAGKTAARA